MELIIRITKVVTLEIDVAIKLPFLFLITTNAQTSNTPTSGYPLTFACAGENERGTIKRSHSVTIKYHQVQLLPPPTVANRQIALQPAEDMHRHTSLNVENKR